MKNKQFDDMIRQALQDMESDFNPGHWSLMERKLDQLSHAADEGDVRFDAYVAGAMSGMEVEYQPDHWALMSQELDAHGAFSDDLAPEDAIDQVAYDALSNAEVPYDPSTWTAFESKLDHYTEHRNKVIRNKVIEATLLLLAFLTFFHFYQSKDWTKPQPARPAESADKHTPLAAQAGSGDLYEGNTDQEAAHLDVASESAHSPSTANNSTHISPVSTSSVSPQIGTEKLTPISGGKYPSIFNAEKEQNILPAVPNTASNVSLLAAFSGIESRLGLVTIDQRNVLTSEASLATPTKKKKSLNYLSIVAGPDVNFIYTPAKILQFQVPFPELWQSATGYHFGVLYGKKWGRFGAETGAMYSYKQYTPAPRFEIIGGTSATGYVGDQAVNAEMDVVQIPLNLTFDILQKPKWTLGVRAGILANVLATKTYDYRRYCQGCDDPDNYILGGTNPGGPAAFPETTHGYLEGGAFSDNVYLNYTAGLSFERKLWNGSAIFLAPQWQGHLAKSVGPDSDVLSTLSIQTGVKVGF